MKLAPRSSRCLAPPHAPRPRVPTLAASPPQGRAHPPSLTRAVSVHAHTRSPCTRPTRPHGRSPRPPRGAPSPHCLRPLARLPGMGPFTRHFPAGPPTECHDPRLSPCGRTAATPSGCSPLHQCAATARHWVPLPPPAPPPTSSRHTTCLNHRPAAPPAKDPTRAATTSPCRAHDAKGNSVQMFKSCRGYNFPSNMHAPRGGGTRRGACP